jgi:spermidine/putrescine transport system permease protein
LAFASFLVPAGKDTLPVYIYSGSRTPALQPQVIAIGAMVVVASLLVVTAAEFFRARAERRLRV